MNSCRTCRHWDGWNGRRPEYGPSPNALCYAIDGDDLAARGVWVAGVYDCDSDPRLMTPPDFGCTLHESIEPPERIPERRML